MVAFGLKPNEDYINRDLGGSTRGLGWTLEWTIQTIFCVANLLWLPPSSILPMRLVPHSCER